MSAVETHYSKRTLSRIDRSQEEFDSSFRAGSLENPRDVQEAAERIVAGELVAVLSSRALRQRLSRTPMGPDMA